MSGRDDSSRQLTELLDQQARRVVVLSADLPRSVSLKKIPRNLSLLRAIDSTLDAIRQDRNTTELHSFFCRQQITRISEKPVQKMLDRDGSVMEKLLTAQRKLKQHHAQLKKCCVAAEADDRLSSDDCVVDEYRKYINAVAELHNDINSLRLAIAQHDAKGSKVVREFDSMREMIDFLKTQ